MARSAPEMPTGLYYRIGKRLLDIALVTLAGPIALVLVAVGWLAAHLSTGGSGIFKQVRIGRGLQPFVILKLRTMRDTAGASVTRADDARITPVGAWLRRFKLDEVPQLWNVFVGDMSIIGPRPEVPPYVETNTDAFAKHLRLVRPGLSDFASLIYHDESVRLAQAPSGLDIYREEILPHKLELGRIYAENVSARLDGKLIVLTLASIVRPDWAAKRADEIARGTAAY